MGGVEDIGNRLKDLRVQSGLTLDMVVYDCDRKFNIEFTKSNLSRWESTRHYYATTGSMLGIPDIVIADMGGWRHDSPIMKNLYQGNITSIADGYAKKMNDHFEKVLK